MKREHIKNRGTQLKQYLEIYGTKHLIREDRAQINDLSFLPKELENMRKGETPSKQKKQTGKITLEINEIENKTERKKKRKLMKPKAGSLRRSIKSINLLYVDLEKKREKTQIISIRNKRRNVTTDSTYIRRRIGPEFEKIHVHCSTIYNTQDMETT